MYFLKVQNVWRKKNVFGAYLYRIFRRSEREAFNYTILILRSFRGEFWIVIDLPSYMRASDGIPNDNIVWQRFIVTSDGRSQLSVETMKQTVR
jgi:hypothetical protein